MNMAKEWKCETNEMVCTLIEQYDQQLQLLDKCYEELADPDCVFCNCREDRYRGEFLVLNPLVQNIPKLTEAANKTAALIMKTIMDVGTKPEVKTESALDKFFNDEDDEGDEDECGTDENGNS